MLRELFRGEDEKDGEFICALALPLAAAATLFVIWLPFRSRNPLIAKRATATSKWAARLHHDPGGALTPRGCFIKGSSAMPLLAVGSFTFPYEK